MTRRTKWRRISWLEFSVSDPLLMGHIFIPRISRGGISGPAVRPAQPLSRLRNLVQRTRPVGVEVARVGKVHGEQLAGHDRAER